MSDHQGLDTLIISRHTSWIHYPLLHVLISYKTPLKWYVYKQYSTTLYMNIMQQIWCHKKLNAFPCIGFKSTLLHVLMSLAVLSYQVTSNKHSDYTRANLIVGSGEGESQNPFKILF